MNESLRQLDFIKSFESKMLKALCLLFYNDDGMNDHSIFDRKNLFFRNRVVVVVDVDVSFLIE